MEEYERAEIRVLEVEMKACVAGSRNDQDIDEDIQEDQINNNGLFIIP